MVFKFSPWPASLLEHPGHNSRNITLRVHNECQGLLYDSLRDERNLLESQANEAASVLSDVEGLYNEVHIFLTLTICFNISTALL
jgi:hypothetical protein